MDDVRAKDAEAVGMWIEEGYRVMGESLLEAVRRGSLEIVKVYEMECGWTVRGEWRNGVA